MDRPELNKEISITDFNDFYWLKEELVDFRKSLGIQSSGGKLDLVERRRHFLLTGEIISKVPKAAKGKSKFNWNSEILSSNTIIKHNYKNNENVRNFFLYEIEPHFSFNIIFIKWMRENVGKTLQDATLEWKKIHKLKKDKNYISDIDPQFEYNRYIRAFLNDNPDLSSKDAMRFWKLKRSKRGSNEYSPDDLGLK